MRHTERTTPYSREWSVRDHVVRQTVDLAAYPDLVVIYIGMRWNSLLGIPTVRKFLHRMRGSLRERPDGLLHAEPMLYSFRQIGMRQYWRDFDSLERWARSPPHRDWWIEYLKGTKGTSFWHETYFMRGGMEAIYDGMRVKMGFMGFAPVEPAQGGMFSARRRARLEGPETAPAPVAPYGPGPDEAP